MGRNIINARPGREKPGERKDNMIFTVFPADDSEMPQDFSTHEEAEDYAEGYLDCDYEIESIDGEIV